MGICEFCSVVENNRNIFVKSVKRGLYSALSTIKRESTGLIAQSVDDLSARHGPGSMFRVLAREIPGSLIRESILE